MMPEKFFYFQVEQLNGISTDSSHYKAITTLAKKSIQTFDYSKTNIKYYPKNIHDGEVQFDAAIFPEVNKSKIDSSPIKGEANVLIFPNLDAGNIAYKITQRLGGYSAWGPLLQGLNKPVHDLSRGCSVDDIINVSAIAALQKNMYANV